MKIAYGKNRFDKKWKNKEISWDDFKKRAFNTTYTDETIDEYFKMSKEQQTEIKDKGGFVAGHLKDGRRRKGMVLCRSAIALDMDYGTPGVWDDVIAKLPYRCLAYPTHKHTPEKPRLRIIIPLSRDVTEAEYPAVARMVARDIGMDLFDDSTYEAHRLMFWPTTSKGADFSPKEKDGRDLNPDEILARYKDWQDESTWPVSSRQAKIEHHGVKEMADPLSKPGIIGSFCRAYSISEAIDTFLSDIYAPSTIENRYTYIPGQSAAGLVIYDDKFAYSHHASDPVCGKLLNAFDLVRLHKFSNLDDKVTEDTPKRNIPSYKAMMEMALADGKVKAQILQDRTEQAKEDFSESKDWIKGLEMDKNGVVKNTLQNLLLIMENDPSLKGIVFNQLADGMEIKDEVPWQHPARFWRDADDAQLVCYVDSNYGTFSKQNYDIVVTKVADDRSYHPIREMFDSLPPWDGIPRAETVLIDYLGADDNVYVKAVTRKVLCAAYMRVYHPGIKFDYMTVLQGEQGIGKSTLISRLGGDWYSDSLSISDMSDKTAAEKLQGYWIMEIGELAGMKKAEIDKVKAFISRQDDKYRASFGKRVSPHPRQSVFFGTVNSEKGYLRDTTGNRRFWIVNVSGQGKHKAWDITEDYVQQIWAEVKTIAESERLYLDANLEDYAREEQRKAMEMDDREGLVLDYLNTLLPENWASMNLYSRRLFLNGETELGSESIKGTVRRRYVSNMEIWCECFGHNKEDMRPADSYAIAAIMARLEDWENKGMRQSLPIYGRQRVYTRTM